MVISTVCKNTFGVCSISYPGSSRRLTKSVWDDILHQRLGYQERLYSTTHAAYGDDRRFLSHRHGSFDVLREDNEAMDSQRKSARLLGFLVCSLVSSDTM